MICTSRYLTKGKPFQNLLKTKLPLSSSSLRHRPFSSSLLHESYSNIIVTQHDPPIIKEGHLSVGLVELNKPKSLNSLSDGLFDDLIHATKALNKMEHIGSIVITGKGKAFAAGADIQEMSGKDFAYAYKNVSKDIINKEISLDTFLILNYIYLYLFIVDLSRICFHNGQILRKSQNQCKYCWIHHDS